MKGGWRCSGKVVEGISRDADNPWERMSLARNKERIVLGFLFPDEGRWLSANTPDEVDFKIDGGAIMTRPALLGHPEIELDSELASALKRGMDVHISIFSREGGVQRFTSHLTGFTRACNCVSQPL